MYAATVPCGRRTRVLNRKRWTISEGQVFDRPVSGVSTATEENGLLLIFVSDVIGQKILAIAHSAYDFQSPLAWLNSFQ